jgi:hypothetical protein
MKSGADIGDVIFDTDELMKKGGSLVLNNMGKLIAAIAAVVAIAVTFADVSFGGFFNESFTSSLLLILCSGYIIYFSLEDAGERGAQGCTEYVLARERYSRARAKISGAEIEQLRRFCTEYSMKEYQSRINAALIHNGIGAEAYESYKNGVRPPREIRRALWRISRIKPHTLTPRMLLEWERPSGASELEDPGVKKLFSLILKLIPSTVCTFVTVCVMLNAKEGLDAADVLSSILRLSALPMLGFKGYCEGYSYTKHSASAWLETKAGILEGFVAMRQSNELQPSGCMN